MPATEAQAIHRAYWLRDEPLSQRFNPLVGQHKTEILVIGAGITGLSVALELLQRGHDVTVCEANVIGSGTTGASTGHVDADPERGPRHLIRQLGEETARVYMDLRRQAVETIARRAGDTRVFERLPGYYYTENENSRDEIAAEFEAAKRLGLDVQWADAVPIPRGVCGYRLENLGRLHCMRYLRRLTEMVTQAGGKIYERTKVASPSKGERTNLTAGSGSVLFEHVVCATHSNYTDSLWAYVETPPYQSYAIAARVNDPPQDALFWDNSDPYYYVRRAGHGDESVIIVGGSDHRTGVGNPLQSVDRLELWTRARFSVTEIVDRWSGEFFEPPDGLPVIGHIQGEPNVWVATGLSGVGLTLGTAAAMILADQIEGRKGALDAALSPQRAHLSSVGEIAREQLTNVANYAERVLPSREVDPAALRPGEGTVGTVDGCHVAVCRDADGNLHRHSPICKHMGGVVHWNPLEQTWDCPVHGGRYAADGSRIYGPPQSPLDPPEKK